jgi:hypothetical protein
MRWGPTPKKSHLLSLYQQTSADVAVAAQAAHGHFEVAPMYAVVSMLRP